MSGNFASLMGESLFVSTESTNTSTLPHVGQMTSPEKQHVFCCSEFLFESPLPLVASRSCLFASFMLFHSCLLTFVSPNRLLTLPGTLPSCLAAQPGAWHLGGDQ